jgi:hypothetical protein
MSGIETRIAKAEKHLAVNAIGEVDTLTEEERGEGRRGPARRRQAVEGSAATETPQGQRAAPPMTFT